MGVSRSYLKGNSSDKCSKIRKFCKLLRRDPLVAVWFKNMGKNQLSQCICKMHELIERNKWTKVEIFNLYRSVNPSVKECERFIYLYKKVFGSTERDNLFFKDFKASVQANYNTPWSKFYKKARKSPLLWMRFRESKYESIMKMSVKMDMLVKGMISEKEMHELAEKHEGFKITEHEFQAFWETFVTDCNRFEKFGESKKKLEYCRLPKNSNSVPSMNQIKEVWPKLMELSPRKGQQRQRRQLMRIKLANERCPYSVTSARKQPKRPQSRCSMLPASNNRYKNSFSPLRRNRHSRNRKMRLPSRPKIRSPFKRSPFKRERADVYSHPQP